MSRTIIDNSRNNPHGGSELVTNGHPVQTAELVLELLEQLHPTKESGDSSLPQVREKLQELIGDVQDLESQLLRQSEELSGWLHARREDSGGVDLRIVARKQLEMICRLTGYRGAALFLLDPTRRRLVLRESYQQEPRQTPRALRLLQPDSPDWLALMQGRQVLLQKTSAIHSRWFPDDVQSACVVRVGDPEMPLGTLWTFDRRSREPSTRELQVIESLIVQLATTIEREVLTHHWRNGQRLRSEVEYASSNVIGRNLDLQLQTSGIDVAGFCRSCSELGGDVCEVMPWDPRRTIVAVGDASGHGVAACMVSAAARGALNVLGYPGDSKSLDTVHAMERVNDALCRLTESYQFMSLVYGVLDTKRKTFRYTNAGHCCPLLVRGRSIIELESHGLLTGVINGSDYESSEQKLESGDYLIFFSDGITEAIGKKERMVRTAGLSEAILSSSGSQSADEMLDSITKLLSLNTHTKADDDQTLLVVRVP
ncbi:PP2C family protein-serine/threonine phosphatase [Thalassoroseus pseudoceratinae]|uniref:PP2C family protein-serine/threonine phosphatase n=1 Tax=Thalassoroseus pseudoceratinae TaxID=2713176 RepID=UPI00141E0756|nr:GAF domain-containing SpoIIE family protein phosphatase [Thalassoroseus pseudoceratinae]